MPAIVCPVSPSIRTTFFLTIGTFDKYKTKEGKKDDINVSNIRDDFFIAKERLKELIKDKTVMVVLDGDHHRVQVKRELYHYAPMVTKGQFIVVEDIFQYSGLVQKAGWSGEAVDWFFKTKLSRGFQKESPEDQFGKWCVTRGGWIRRT